MDSAFSQPDSVSSYGVRTGIWINWSHGKILGTTLTTSRVSGSLLIASISLFVTIVGTHFWRIGCFVFHYAYSTEAPQDGVYHQRQAIIRNAANGANGLWRVSQLLFTWRSGKTRRISRLLPIAAFAIATLGGFTVASTFSSRIATLTGNSVLVLSRNCGYFDYDKHRNFLEMRVSLQPYFVARLTSGANYVQQCYKGTARSAGCTKFVKPRLPLEVIRNATCPFAKSICKSQDTNILLDTGHLDSHGHFGLNAPQDKRFSYRRVLHCAPLKTRGHRKRVSVTRDGIKIPYMRYQYGDLLASPRKEKDFTYEYPVLLKQKARLEYLTGGLPDYNLKNLQSFARNGSIDSDTSDFTPIRKLQRLDADLLLVFLSANSVLFTEQTNDPWYSAHDYAGPLYIPGLEDYNGPTYFSDETASPLACALQHQVCNSQPNRTCTPLASIEDTQDLLAPALWNDEERVRALQFSIYFWLQMDYGHIIYALGASLLDSSFGKNGGIQSPVPDNQWQADVENWMRVWLALMQQSFLDAASGPSDPELLKWVVGPSSDEERRMCRNQMMLSTAYNNFSIFGLATILTVGGLIIFISYTLEPFANWIQKRRNLDVYASIEWSMNDALQLQRLAHEELGMGRWTRCDRDVPITKDSDRLAMLDLQDPKHPRLKAPPLHFEEILANQHEKRQEQVTVAETQS